MSNNRSGYLIVTLFAILVALLWAGWLASNADPLGLRAAAAEDAAGRVQVAAYNAQAQTAGAQANAQAAIQVAAYNAQAQTAGAQANAQSAIQVAAYNAQVSIAWASVLPLLAVLVLLALLLGGAMALGFLLLAGGRARRPVPAVVYDWRALPPPAAWPALPPPVDRWDDFRAPAPVVAAAHPAAGRRAIASGGGIVFIE